MKTPPMLTGSEFVDAVVHRLNWNRECHAALRTERFTALELRGVSDEDYARARQIENHRVAANETGALVHALGGRQLMQSVLESAEDTYGPELSSWVSNVWTGIQTGPGEGDVWP